MRLWGFANYASLRLLDMTQNAPHIWTFSLSAWSASYGLVGLRQILHGMLNRSRSIIELSSYRAWPARHPLQDLSKTDRSIGSGPDTQRESSKVRGISGHIEQAERGAIRKSPQAHKQIRIYQTS